jgi:hypothetical protein
MNSTALTLERPAHPALAPHQHAYTRAQARPELLRQRIVLLDGALG